MNLVIFSGNLAKDARLITTSSGRTCCVTTLALREDLRPEDKPAVFVDIIVWGDRAEKLAKFLTKGKAISVTGRLEIVKTTKGDTTYISPRVVVQTLEFLGKKTIEGVTTGQPVVSTEESVNEIGSNEDVPF